MKKKTLKRALYYAALFVLLIVFLFSAYKIYSYYAEKKESTDLNEDIAYEYTIRKTGERKEYFAVDFEKLKQQNADAVAWIYLPDTVINYPVLQHGDNDYYLDHQIDGSVNANGSIFMDYRNAPDFSDRNTLIHGHHMRSGNMFAGLMNYKKGGYYEKHDHMYIMTPQGTYRMDLLCGSVVEAFDDIYSAEPTQEAIAACMRKSRFQSSLGLPEEDAKIVTLSTCSYEFDDARFVVLGVLSPVEEAAAN